ncbi:MAG: DUF2779 domain-containing protein [Planctomycetota bacterium]
MSKRAPLASGSRPLDKALFQSGMQCAKRLYLDYHQPSRAPGASPDRDEQLEAGRRLLELARQAFPGCQTCDADDADRAVEQTREFLSADRPAGVFDAAFRAEGVEIRTDVALPHGPGVDIFEVKSGTRVKARYLQDVALQVWVIEKSGLQVQAVTILHVNPSYKHRGGDSYPVQALFKSVDVTKKVRKLLPRIEERIVTFRSLLEDPVTKDLPTGTWCNTPFPCGYLPSCRREGSKQPLLDLPDLTRDQERELHELGIEDLSAIPTKHPGLTLLQRRSLRSLQESQLIVEPFVGRELADLELPLHFIDLTCALQVLPAFTNTRPWQQIPFQWACTTVTSDGTRKNAAFTAANPEDARPAFLVSLAETIRAAGGGTVVVWGAAFEGRLRELLEDVPDHKAEARAVLNATRFDLRQQIHAGVYHADFRGSFEFRRVIESLVDDKAFAGLKIDSTHLASSAFQRLLNSRTRAATRTKLQTQLQELGQRRSEAMADLFAKLVDEQPAS